MFEIARCARFQKAAQIGYGGAAATLLGEACERCAKQRVVFGGKRRKRDLWCGHQAVRFGRDGPRHTLVALRAPVIAAFQATHHAV